MNKSRIAHGVLLPERFVRRVLDGPKAGMAGVIDDDVQATETLEGRIHRC